MRRRIGAVRVVRLDELSEWLGEVQRLQDRISVAASEGGDPSARPEKRDRWGMTGRTDQVLPNCRRGERRERHGQRMSHERSHLTAWVGGIGAADPPSSVSARADRGEGKGERRDARSRGHSSVPLVLLRASLRLAVRLRLPRMRQPASRCCPERRWGQDRPAIAAGRPSTQV